MLNRLCAAADGTIVTIVAPAGYGKTTLLSQWAERDSREVLRIGLLPEDDNAELLGALLEPLAHEPGLLALVDDVHVLRSRAALDAFARILGSAAPGTTVGLATRRVPQLPLARLRAQGRLLEIGSDDLALKGRDGETLIRRAGVLLPRPEATALCERFEGWPAALFLAALALRNGAHASAIGGDDRFLADFLETEHLSSLSSAQRQFAAQTAVLEQLTAEACDSLLERSDSRRLLEALENAGVVVPLDNQRRRYRYPRVVRDYLCAELERSQPDRARALHRLAAARAAESGAIEEAIRHAAAAGEPADVAAFADLLAVSACGRGRLDLLEPWLDLLRDDLVVESHPDLCIAASWLYALRGRTADAQHWSDAATRGLKGSDARLHVLRALRCRDGADQMLDDANAACQKLPAGHAWRPAAVLARGTALLLADDAGKAEHELVEAIELATAAGATELAIVGLCLRALLAVTENERADAEAFTNEAVSIAAVEPPAESVAALLLAAVEARNSARGDDLADAASGLERAEQLLDLVTPAVPWLGDSRAPRARAGPPRPRRRRRGPRSPATCCRRPPRQAAAGHRRAAQCGARPAHPRACRTRRSLGVEPDPGGTTPAAATRNSSVVPRDRRATLRLPQHREDAGDRGLPQVRRHQPKRGDRARGRVGADRRSRGRAARRTLVRELSGREHGPGHDNPSPVRPARRRQ